MKEWLESPYEDGASYHMIVINNIPDSPRVIAASNEILSTGTQVNDMSSVSKYEIYSKSVSEHAPVVGGGHPAVGHIALRVG